jgi:hypothetical protein
MRKPLPLAWHNRHRYLITSHIGLRKRDRFLAVHVCAHATHDVLYVEALRAQYFANIGKLLEQRQYALQLTALKLSSLCQDLMDASRGPQIVSLSSRRESIANLTSKMDLPRHVVCSLRLILEVAVHQVDRVHLGPDQLFIQIPLMSSVPDYNQPDQNGRMLYFQFETLSL